MAEAARKSELRDTFESLVVTVILAVFGTTFVLQAFKIPTGSMENTLLVGDHLLVNKFVFANHAGWLAHLLPYRDIRRGDVVVFKFPYADDQTPDQEPGEHFVKRVIGVPGDHIRLVHRRLFVNGQPVQEPYARYAYPNILTAVDDFPPLSPEDIGGSTARWREELPRSVSNGDLVVPPGHYFVMGDNREQSWDSRFWGFVPREVVSGRPLLIYWSYETPRDEYRRNSLSDRAGQILDLLIHLPTKTRWRRTFRFVR